MRRRAKKQIEETKDKKIETVPTPTFDQLKRLMRVLINDAYGEVIESVVGWKDEIDSKMAIQWANAPALVNFIIYVSKIPIFHLLMIKLNIINDE